MDQTKVIESFVKLGDEIEAFLELKEFSSLKSSAKTLEDAVKNASETNPWFSEEFIRHSLQAIRPWLLEEKLVQFNEKYQTLMLPQQHSVPVGVVMAGNIPLVGFHDFLCVLLSGHKFYGKLSSNDQILLPALAGIAVSYYPELDNHIVFFKNQLSGFEAVIATGSNNTSRYFEYYFGKYPHIIRKNRNGIAVLDGSETGDDMKLLAKDIFTYFGLGCRNVSKLYIPRGFDLSYMMNQFGDFEHLAYHNRYQNNYDYYKSIFMVNGTPFKDNGYLLATESTRFSSPLAVLYYEYYRDIESLVDALEQDREQIQCIVTGVDQIPAGIGFGESQHPDMEEYADDIDTMEFLLQLSR